MIRSKSQGMQNLSEVHLEGLYYCEDKTEARKYLPKERHRGTGNTDLIMKNAKARGTSYY